MVTTESGLQYKDIKVGAGPSPPVGFQVRTESNHCNLRNFIEIDVKMFQNCCRLLLIMWLWFHQGKFSTGDLSQPIQKTGQFDLLY